MVVQATVLLLAATARVLQVITVQVLLTHLREAATCLPAVEVLTTVTLPAEVLQLQAVHILLHQEAVTRLHQDNKRLLLKALQEVVA